MHRIGPAPFHFAATGGRVQGAAFTSAFRVFTTIIVGGCAVWMLLLWASGAMVVGNSTGIGWLTAALAMMGWTCVNVMCSHTSINEDGLYQRWVWDKRMEYADLAYARLIRVAGLEWLIAPRLYARTLTGKFNVFYGATPELIAEFERMVTELRSFRQL